MAENPNARLEAFCDGVFAIAITLLVIEVGLPTGQEIDTTAVFWEALWDILPSILAFLLSFVVILITWVNHRTALMLVARSSPAFIYANGLLLLTVAFIPFPTEMLGKFVTTDHAAPAVVIYNAVIAVQALAWILIGLAVLDGGLTKDQAAATVIRANTRNGVFAFVLYGAAAIAAFWIPQIVALLTAASWVFWLVYGISIHGKSDTAST
jgi:TMEM175 potassium channel family protein